MYPMSLLTDPTSQRADVDTGKGAEDADCMNSIGSPSEVPEP